MAELTGSTIRLHRKKPPIRNPKRAASLDPQENREKMHRPLQILEIVESILRYSTTGTVLAIGLTCKGLSEVALGYLWGENRLSMTAILQPLVASGALGAMPWYGPAESRLLRFLDRQDWDRLTYYFSRVKTLCWMEDSGEANIFRVLLTTSPRVPLFPRLRHISYISSTIENDGLFLCSQLVTPLLLSFDIWSNLHGPAPDLMQPGALSLSSCLLGLTARCPLLRELKLSVDCKRIRPLHNKPEPWFAGIVDTLMVLLQSLQNLEDVSIFVNDIPPFVVNYLAVLPRLKRLELSVSSEEILRVTPLRYPTGLLKPFPCLEVLAVEMERFGEDWGRNLPMSRFIGEVTQRSPLKEIWWQCRTREDIKTVLAACGPLESETPSELTSFSFSHGLLVYVEEAEGDEVLDENNSFTIQDISRLSTSRYRVLEDLYITVLFPNLNDEDLITFGGWLPKLKSLSMWCSDYHNLGIAAGLRPRPTLRGLINLNRACPGLERLDMGFFLRPIAPASNIDSFPNRLKEWSVKNSYVADHQRFSVAATLARFFPSLTSLICWEDDAEQVFQPMANFLRQLGELRQSAGPTLLEDKTLRDIWNDSTRDL